MWWKVLWVGVNTEETGDIYECFLIAGRNIIENNMSLVGLFKQKINGKKHGQ